MPDDIENCKHNVEDILSWLEDASTHLDGIESWIMDMYSKIKVLKELLKPFNNRNWLGIFSNLNARRNEIKKTSDDVIESYTKPEYVLNYIRVIRGEYIHKIMTVR